MLQAGEIDSFMFVVFLLLLLFFVSPRWRNFGVLTLGALGSQPMQGLLRRAELDRRDVSLDPYLTLANCRVAFTTLFP